MVKPVKHGDGANEFYSVKEVARLFKLSPRTVWRWIESGMIVPHRLGRVVRISRAEIDRLINPSN
jgi:excisionase family DNA binding protein